MAGFTPHSREKGDLKIVRLMTRNNAWFERDIEEKSLQVEFQMHGVEKIIRDDGGGGVQLHSGLFSVDPYFLVYEPDTRPRPQSSRPKKIQFQF